MKNKINIITIVSCILVVVLLSVMFLVLPDKEFSQKENRSLTTVPTLNTSQLFSGEYTTNLARYISDQFPLRDGFVGLKAYSELLLGKRENNGVIYAVGDILIDRDTIMQNRLSDNLQAVKDFEIATNANVCVAVLPRAVDVFSEYLPSTYPTQNDCKLWQNYYKIAEEKGLVAPNLYDELCAGNNYYRTDHHYNVYGAYQTYKLLGKTLGYKPKELSFFKQEVVSRDFCGTSMRTSGFYLAKKDSITLLRYETDTGYSIVADEKNIQMYDKSRLKTTDQYSVFLGGNHARVDISSNAGKEKLLVIRDSFADSLAPFLALHYDLVMLDLRYFSGNVQQLVAQENIQQVLILQSMAEFASAKNISYLRKSVK